MSDTCADTTSMGLFLISFIMLVFGIVGIFGYTGDSGYGGIAAAAVMMMLPVGILFAFVGYSAWKGGNKFLMVIFAFLALFSLSYHYLAPAPVDGTYIFFIIAAVFLLVFTLWTLLAKAGYFLALILLCAAMVFLFFALVLNATILGDDPKTFYLLLGVFGIIAAVLSIWMALADVTDMNLPVV